MTNLHKKSILKKTALVGVLSLLSKFMGIIREVIQVRYLGVGALSDAFNIAFRIPQLLRRLFAEGALSAAFIPTVIKVMRNDSEKQVSRLMTAMYLFFGVIILALCLIVSLWPGWVIDIFAPGFRTKPIEFEIATKLIAILIYFVFFVFSSALLAGALQAKMHFAIPSWGPALMNMFYIGGMLICMHFGLSIEIFAYSLLLGGFVQSLLSLFMYFKLNFTFLMPNKTTVKYMGEVLGKFVPSLLSVGALEINLLIDNRFASALPTGSVTLLNISSRFMGIALGAFAVAFSSILLSHFSRISSYAPKRLSYYLLEATKFIFWITIPVSLLMTFFAHDIFYTVFYRLTHNFTEAQVNEAASLLIAFLPGLFFFSFNKIVLSLYYSLHETKITMIITLIGTAANIGLNRLLMAYYGAWGIAVATVLAGVLQSILFVIVLQKKYKFVLYYKRFFQFLGWYIAQLAVLSSVFYVFYKLCVAFVERYLPRYADFLLHAIGLWFWVGPLCLILCGLLYLARNKYGLKLYFLD